jgi:hypothetical protein
VEPENSLANPSELVHQSRDMKRAPMWIGVLAGALLLAGTGCRSVYYGNAALTRAEESMAPVLTQLKDYTLYLKHNVNAAAIASNSGAIASLRGEHPGRHRQTAGRHECINREG